MAHVLEYEAGNDEANKTYNQYRNMVDADPGKTQPDQNRRVFQSADLCRW